MPKTYAPQFIRVLRRLALYATKHATQLKSVMSTSEYAAVQSIVATYNETFATYNETEQP